MNRLFPVIALALLSALVLSMATSWYLQINPVFKADLVKLKTSLETATDEVWDLLNDQPEEKWDELLLSTELDKSFSIDWYSIEHIDIPIEEEAQLKLKQRLVTVDFDDTPTTELLFTKQQLVLIITPLESHHQTLNTAVSVLAILTICILSASLVLLPIANRLKKLQSLSEAYAEGQWHTKNTDTSGDPIGRLGESMNTMASEMQGLVDNNNALVKDQRDLMQAVAHEFRAPMARMRFALEMRDDNKIDINASDEISNALDELNDMVSEVLLYSRMQITAPDLNYGSYSLAQLITECAEKCRLMFPDINISEDTTISEQIDTDPTHLQRALINLISNAAKYGDTEVLISTEIKSGNVTIHVDDDGNGIASENRTKALKPFVRLDSSRTRNLGGTGLGLAIANGVALKHRGKLIIADSPLGGARLSMTLPMQQ